MEEIGYCCICGSRYTDGGANPSPVKKTRRCCKWCDENIVTNEREKELENQEDEGTSTTYYETRARNNEIKNLIESKTGLIANVFVDNIEVTYDKRCYKGLKFSPKVQNDEILDLVQYALFNNCWEYEYTKNPNTIILESIFDEHILIEYDYVIDFNAVKRIKSGGKTETIVDTESIRNITLETDELGDFERLILKTEDNAYILSGESK